MVSSLGLDECPSCKGFVPPACGACPNCGSEVRCAGKAPARALGAAGRAASVGLLSMTLMACYGAGYDGPPDGYTGAGGSTSSSSASGSGGSGSGGSGATATGTGGSGSGGNGAGGSGSGGSGSGGNASGGNGAGGG